MRRSTLALLVAVACNGSDVPVSALDAAVAPFASVAPVAPSALPSVADSAATDASPRDAAAVASPPPPPSVYVRAHSLAIHADATLKGDWIGLLVAGESVRLRAAPAASARGCASVRAIEPRGWVCVDGEGATLDGDDPIYRALRSHAPDPASALPFSYGESRGTRRQRNLSGAEATRWPPVVFDPRAEVAPRSTVAWTDEVDVAGTTWLRASDMSFVRKDRVVPFEPSDFRGVELGGEVHLPLAFFKASPHTKYRREARDGRPSFTATSDTWPRLGWVALTGKSEKRGGRTFWETLEEGVWIDARGAAIVAPEVPSPSVARGTSIEVAALQGWLVAWQGAVPVYATMISAGKLGAAKPEGEHPPHQPPATTPIGTFRVTEKLLTTTLQSDLDDGTDFVHAEVPWSQRFFDKYLLHTAYWHDRWGEGHSGGCVNLSPADARWLFGWSEPRLPEGWHAVRASESGENQGSTVVIHP